MSCARVTSLIPVTMSASAKTASGNDAGLNLWTRRPSRSQRISSLAAKPIATSRNWKWNQSHRTTRVFRFHPIWWAAPPSMPRVQRPVS